ncbi:TonB-dependent receptor [Gammaproteobacteria bacterium]|nr:TonB-dependent receptor [Gammaproteobacteria bacterium]
MKRILRVGFVTSVLAFPMAGADELEEIIVRAEASVVTSTKTAGSGSAVNAETLELVRANHIHEALVRIPGVWVSRGSGQEHLTAIRSGVLTGPGACGGFLFLEDGIPIRPAGFCNVNNLFEINSEQASALEVVRGPASARFGGNALHGVINSISFTRNESTRASVEIGPYQYLQGRFASGSDRFQFNAHGSRSDGYRDDTGYDQYKVTTNLSTNQGKWKAVHTFSATRLNQETGGYVKGELAYKDSTVRRTNPNPEAYRDATSIRVASHWSLEQAAREWSVAPYVRQSDMEFRQHFLPGKPLEKNDQTSLGVITRVKGSATNTRWLAGAQVETMRGGLSERQNQPTTGSAYLVGTRPEGTHYDYDISSFLIAAFYDLGWDIAENVELIHSVRLERLNYDYDNRHLDGNSRDDGSACGFGGCLYTRPADREDDFTDVAGRIGVRWNANPELKLYALTGIGFRPPQATELYRLQSGQTVAGLTSESLRSLEVGVNATSGRLDMDVSTYFERTNSLIFRDADGYNVSDGKTRSGGVEADFMFHLNDVHTLALVATFARHQYDFTRDASRGEKIVSGNDVDTAPRWIASARWQTRFSDRASFEFELSHIGSHFINAANTAKYPGHTLLNWRGNWDVSNKIRLFARVINLFDKEYADRADYAFGSYRYFPGLPRQFYLGAELEFD